MRGESATSANRPEDLPEHGAAVLEDAFEVGSHQQAVDDAPSPDRVLHVVARQRLTTALLEAVLVDPEGYGPRRCSSRNRNDGSHAVISLRHRSGTPRRRRR